MGHGRSESEVGRPAGGRSRAPAPGSAACVPAGRDPRGPSSRWSISRSPSSPPCGRSSPPEPPRRRLRRRGAWQRVADVSIVMPGTQRRTSTAAFTMLSMRRAATAGSSGRIELSTMPSTMSPPKRSASRSMVRFISCLRASGRALKAEFAGAAPVRRAGSGRVRRPPCRAGPSRFARGFRSALDLAHHREGTGKTIGDEVVLVVVVMIEGTLRHIQPGRDLRPTRRDSPAR